jgi:transposase
VKPYVKRNKNDAADAEAICEAVSRPRSSLALIERELTDEEEALVILHTEPPEGSA